MAAPYSFAFRHPEANASAHSTPPLPFISMAQSATDRTRRLDLIFLSMSGPQAHVKLTTG